MFIRKLSRNSIRFYADKIINTPYMADSITQGTLASWEKKVGQFVKQDELVANIETDKVTIPVNCPESGLLKEIFAKEGETVEVGSNLFKIDTDAIAPIEKDMEKEREKDVKNVSVKGSVQENISSGTSVKTAERPHAVSSLFEKQEPVRLENNFNVTAAPREHREKMSRMRIRIGERMKEAQNTAASLTTFNEVDMSALIKLRSQLKDDFLKAHGVKLGYMSAFVKACSAALIEIPAINARIDGKNQEIIYSESVDISVAVATPKGLVTPVLRGCEKKTFAEVEKEISDFGIKAREGRIALEDLSGGTFTISNGGVFGSMMGTPILNSPQSAILGMHAIKDRAVVIDSKIEVRPMMYLALTYDHRLIDGREAVTFLVRVKELLENPTRFLFGL